MSGRNIRAAAAVVALAVGGGLSLGQECGWLPGEGVPGTDGRVSATTTWDPDGPGPQPELLVVAGDFGTAGRAPCNHIGTWDGANWQALGTGTDIPVGPLAVFNGELIAGG